MMDTCTVQAEQQQLFSTGGAECSVVVEPCKVVEDLLWLSEQCEQRCMFEAAKWANEQLNHLPSDHFGAFESSSVDDHHQRQQQQQIPPARRRSLISFARILIINRDYNRAKFFLSKIEHWSSLESFLYYFSWYMISVRNRCENEADELDRKEEFVDAEMPMLRSELEKLKCVKPELFDCFLNYLLGTVWKECGAEERAIEAFSEALQQDGRCWPAWESLSGLVDGFYSLKIGKEEHAHTWLYTLFAAETMFRLQKYIPAIQCYMSAAKHLGASPYILCQIAAAQSELQEHDGAISSFMKIRKMDPCRIEQMHFYSDSLYIRQNFVELSLLAKWFYESHKYHWETCCIVANYYSAKNIHEQAQEFLKRAIKLCPTNASTWVLLGHEFLETKNHQQAAAAYKKATVIDSLCYRGWYGLGQLHEILKQPASALYFYQRAHKCRPTDSRMLIALGVIFAKLERKSDAEKCFKKAFQIGDVEGNALVHLAKLYEEQNNHRNAAKAYEAYLTLYSEELVGDLSLIATACRFLARHNLELANLDTAYAYAQRCLNFGISKEEGQRILRLIMSKRKEQMAAAVQQQQQLQEGTPSQAQQRNNLSATMRTPTDAPRPLGGGDDSSLGQTPINTAGAAAGRKEVDLASCTAQATNSDEEMNTNSDDDDDLEISF